jgi:hypothetical protein
MEIFLEMGLDGANQVEIKGEIFLRHSGAREARARNP